MGAVPAQTGGDLGDGVSHLVAKAHDVWLKVVAERRAVEAAASRQAHPSISMR